MNLRGKIAIVTGAAKGIGRATVECFGDAGARLVLADSDKLAGEELAGSLVDQKREAVFVPADVSDEEQVAALVATAIGNFGGVDILVNSAGIMEFQLIENTPHDMWRRTIDSNLTGTFLCVKHALPAMKRRGAGAIVNIASVHSILTGPEAGAYAASKGGVLALTRNMALELGEYGIRVNSLLPGTVMTQMFMYAAKKSGDSKLFIKRFEREIALRRIGEASEIAKVVAFLCSDDASYITGAGITVDGGLTAQLSFPK